MSNNRFINKLNQIWDEAEGDDIAKAHAVLKNYFQKPYMSIAGFSIFNEKDKLIQLFTEKKSRYNDPLDTIDKLISAAAQISSGPALQQHIDIIAVRMSKK